MSRNIIILFLLLSSSPIMAQLGDSNIVIRKPYPIISKSGMYYYNLQRFTFDGLQLVLHSIQDEQINRSVKIVHTLRDVRDFIRIGVIGYGLIILKTDQQSATMQTDKAANVIIGGLATTVMIYFVGKLYESKAVKRYNSLLLKPRASFDEHKSLSLGLIYRF